MSELPIIRQAQRDLELGRLALAVFDVLRDQLDLVEFRPVKLQALADALERTRPRIIGALRELTTRGYLERGDVAWARGPRTYRLCYSKGRSVAAGDPPSGERKKPGSYGMISRGLDW